MTELKPCPFCGSSLDIFFEDSYKVRLGCYWSELRCFRCGASIHGYGNTKEVAEDHARHRWNTRAERTCTVEMINDCLGYCSECDEDVHKDERYCSNCDAKVAEWKVVE